MSPRDPRPGRAAPEAGTDALFRELRAGRNPGARAALIERHLSLALALAARYRRSPQPLEDLQQVASLALVKAVDAYDPSRGVPFAGFAVPTILGELKRHLRDATWDVHVPRAVKERVAAVEQAERRLTARAGTPPTVAALAAEAGVSPEEVLDALAARGAHDALSLEPTASGEAAALERAGALADFSDAVDDRLALSGALRSLHPRERTILRLRLLDGLTQSEIAARVGLSQMYVSRLLRASIERLRAELDRD